MSVTDSKIIQPTRRGFLVGMGLVLAAPAIVRASSLMPVRSFNDRSHLIPDDFWWIGPAPDLTNNEITAGAAARLYMFSEVSGWEIKSLSMEDFYV